MTGGASGVAGSVYRKRPAPGAPRASRSEAPSPFAAPLPRQRRGVSSLQLVAAPPFTADVSDSRSRSNVTSTSAREPASAVRSPRVPESAWSGRGGGGGGGARAAQETR